MSRSNIFPCSLHVFFFFNDTATTEIYTLSLHDALPISFTELVEAGEGSLYVGGAAGLLDEVPVDDLRGYRRLDRKSPRLNSRHAHISYAGFCLKKKNKKSSHANTSYDGFRLKSYVATSI